MNAFDMQPSSTVAREMLYTRPGLEDLDRRFLDWLARRTAGLHGQLLSARMDPEAVGAWTESQLIVELAPHLESFLAGLFGIEGEVARLQQRHAGLDALFEAKRRFVQRYALKKVSAAEVAQLDASALLRQLEAHLRAPLSELALAQQALVWLADEASYAAQLHAAARYAAWAVHDPAGRHRHREGVLFRVSEKHDPLQHVAVFTCFNQDQDMDRVNFPSLRERLSQNSVQEKLSRLWINQCLADLAAADAAAR